MYRFFFLVLLIVVPFFTAYSQLYTGGEFGINYNNGLYVDVAPLVGYKNDDVRVGVSPVFSYFKANNEDPLYSMGSRVFGEYTIAKGAYLHAEVEALNTEVNNNRQWVYALPLGAGYRYAISSKATAYSMILYDVLLDPESPKENPIIRAGVNYAF